jgi:hypothetical protein
MNPYWLVLALSAMVQLILVLRWLHRIARDDEINRAFVRDMAMNHLPHIYHALRQLAAHLGIEIAEPPAVRFVEIEGKDRRER